MAKSLFANVHVRLDRILLNFVKFIAVFSICGPIEYAMALCANKDENGNWRHPTLHWIDCDQLNKPTSPKGNPNSLQNRAAAIEGLMGILRGMEEREERSRARESEIRQRESEKQMREIQILREKIDAEKRAYDQEFARIAENLKRSQAQKGDCDCAITQGSCLANIKVIAASGVSGGYSAEYKVTSSTVCSKVEYLIDNTPNITVLKSASESIESAFGTSPITQSTFQVMSCKPCKRN